MHALRRRASLLLGAVFIATAAACAPTPPSRGAAERVPPAPDAAMDTVTRPRPAPAASQDAAAPAPARDDAAAPADTAREDAAQASDLAALDTSARVEAGPASDASAPDTAAGAGGLPAPWQHRDVGVVKLPGDAQHQDGAFSIKMSGKDVWHGDDYFHFVYQPLKGDGEIVARLVSVGKTDGDYERGGLMLRHDPEFKWVTPSAKLAPGVQLSWNPAQKIVWGERVRAEGQGNWWGPGPNVIADGATLPVWLKIVRKGNRFTGYYSQDGQTWTIPSNSDGKTGASTLDVPETIWVGLFGCAHSDTKQANTVIDSVKITPAQ